MSFNPKVTIITVVYNGESTLEATIKSVANQSYTNIEYIIVDGNSKDSTLSIIKKHKQVITKWISEPDKGIYDAMNKGIDLATGEYLWFMNSGDEIAGSDVLSNILVMHPDADIYYGETVMIDKKGNMIGNRRLNAPKNLTWKSFKKGMLVSHQSFIVKTKLVNHYNLKYNFSADYEWCLLAIKKSRLIVNTHIVLSRFLDGGITKQNIVPGLMERFKIMVYHYGLLSTLYHHVFISIKFLSFLLRHKRF